MPMNLDLARLVDLVIVITLVEFLALALYRRGTGRGIGAHDFAANMLSGLCLMLALRSRVVDAGAAWVALWLVAAGIAHATDIVGRLMKSNGVKR